MLVKFRIRGNLRFLSHAEMLKVFQRACVRAGINLRYSEGFNPRPKLSLPLPRSVGVESDDELLALRVSCGADVAGQVSQIEAGLCGELPEGCEVLSASVADGPKLPRACSATYRVAARSEYLDDELKNRIKDLLASATVVVRRQVDAKASRFKDVDVRGFLRSVELDEKGVFVECEISSAGSIRVEEILELLRLDAEKLARPVRRTSVRWQES